MRVAGRMPAREYRLLPMSFVRLQGWGMDFPVTWKISRKGVSTKVFSLRGRASCAFQRRYHQSVHCATVITGQIAPVSKALLKVGCPEVGIWEVCSRFAKPLYGLTPVPRVRILPSLPFSLASREISPNRPRNKRNCPYFAITSLKDRAEKTALPNDKAFYSGFSPGLEDRSDFANLD